MPKASRLKEVAERLRSALSKRSSGDELLTSSLVGKAPLDLMPSDPQSVIRLAHSKLHSYYPFSEVPRCWRRCYEEACLWAVLLLLESSPDIPIPPNVEDKIVQLCDDAIIMTGAPGRRHLIDQVLDAIDMSGDEEVLNALFPTEEDTELGLALNTIDADVRFNTREEHARDERPAKKARLQRFTGNGTLCPTFAAGLPQEFPVNSTTDQREYKSDHPVPRVERPTLMAFTRLLSVPAPTPVVITGSLDHWPALNRWKDPRYWMHRTHQGRRRVPVEWGRSYVDSGWGQSIVPFGQFLKEEMLGLEADDTRHQIRTGSPQANRGTGYLAQHDLLGQIPALRNDIAVPDYCYCCGHGVDETSDKSSENDSTEALLNIWLGPADTVSPAHTDPHHNLLAQVFGKKFIRLFSPDQTPHLYPMGSYEGEGVGVENNKGYSMANTSSVDVGLEVAQFPHPSLGAHGSGNLPGSVRSQRERFPRFHADASFVECVLQPGEMLFIPRGWWHYIRSLEPSCNVSFWWD